MAKATSETPTPTDPALCRPAHAGVHNRIDQLIRTAYGRSEDWGGATHVHGALARQKSGEKLGYLLPNARSI